MEVVACFRETGEICTVEIDPDDTVLIVKQKALQELLQTTPAASQAAAGRYTLCLAGSGPPEPADDSARIAGIELQSGSTVHLHPLPPATSPDVTPAIYRCANAVLSIAVSPCARYCAVTHPKGLELWHTESGHRLHTLQCDASGGTAFSPASASQPSGCLAVGGGSTLTLLSLQLGEMCVLRAAHPVSSVAWSPCGRTAGCSGGDAATAWVVWGGLAAEGIPDPFTVSLSGTAVCGGQIKCLALMQSAVAADSQHRLVVWDMPDMESPAPPQKVRVMPAVGEECIADIVPACEGTLLAVASWVSAEEGCQSTVRLWDAASWSCVAALGCGHLLSSLAVSADGAVVAGVGTTVDEGLVLQLWQPGTGALLGGLSWQEGWDGGGEDPLARIRDVALSPCGQWVFARRDSCVHVLHAPSLATPQRKEKRGANRCCIQ